MTLHGEITVGDLLTIFSVLVSAAALLYSWRKDQQLRRTRYADRIRRGASAVAAKLDRWPELAGQLFDDVQPLFLDVDHSREIEWQVEARRLLYRGLYEKRALASQRISDERIELAWVDLYGYDPRIRALFQHAVTRIQAIDERYFAQLRDLARGASSATSDHFSVALRQHVAALAQTYEQEMTPVLDAFRAEVLKLIEADDAQILARAVPLAVDYPPTPPR